MNRRRVFYNIPTSFWILFVTVVVFVSISYVKNTSATYSVTAYRYPEVGKKNNRFLEANGGSKGTLVIGILSAEENVCLREAQRKLFIPQARLYERLDIKVFFVLDNRTPDLDEEQRINGDMFFLNTSVHGWNNGYAKKVHTWFKFVVTNFPGAVLMGRMDDDVFVCTPQIFDRLVEVNNELLYYGYPTGYPRDCTKDCVDDMFLFIGIELARRVTRRHFCEDLDAWVKDCLYNGNGGHMFRFWIDIYKDFVFVDERANDKMIFYYREFLNQTEYRKYITGNFCEKYLLYHKASASDIYRMNQHNGILLKDTARTNISEIDVNSANQCPKYYPEADYTWPNLEN